MKLDIRKNRILAELLKGSGSVTGEYLAKILGVSSRTIRNDIRVIEEELKKHDLNLSSVPGVGYSIQVISEQNFAKLTKALLATEEDYIVPFMPDDRIHYIIKKLLCANDFVTLEQIAEELYVSKSTIDKDIPKAEHWLNQHNLTLVKRPNYGLKLMGEELALRYATADFLKIAHTTFATLDIEKMNELIQDDDVILIRQALAAVHQDHPFKLSDMAYTNLIIHIAIAVKRIFASNNIQLPSKEIQNIKRKPEYGLAKKIIRNLEQVFPLKFPETEVLYITLHLLGTQVFEDEKIDVETVSQTVEKELILSIQDMLANIDRIYKVKLSQDKELFVSLILHLRTTLSRLTYRMGLKNPMLNEIKEEYPQAFEMAIVATKSLECNHGVTFDENEIGYLAIHFGAAIERQKAKQKTEIKNVIIVCASGMGSAQLLAAKVKRYFAQLTILGIYPAYKLEFAKGAKPDLILSTIPLPEQETPVIQVSPLLNKKDIENINLYVGVGQGSVKPPDQHAVAQFCSEEIILTKMNCLDNRSAIDILSNRLLEHGYVDKQYVDSVWEREQISTTAIGNLVAIPHALSNHAIGSHIAIGVLKKPVKWGDNCVQLVFLLAFDKLNEQELEEVFNKLYEIVSNRQMITNMIHGKNAAQILQSMGKEV